MATITFNENKNENTVLRDVEVGVSYEVSRFLDRGDEDIYGNRVHTAGVEFEDDVGDVVALALDKAEGVAVLTL